MTPKFKYALAAAAIMIAPAAHAITITDVDLEQTELVFAGSSDPIDVGDKISGKKFTFKWDSSTDVAPVGASGAFTFSFSGRAKLSFDDYVDLDGGTGANQSGFVLYSLTPGVPALTSQLPDGGSLGGGPVITTSIGVPLLQNRQRILIGDTTTSVDAGNVLYDAIAGTDAFGSGEYAIGFFDRNTPAKGEITMTLTAIPLPASVFLMLAGLGALGAARRFAS
jgi:hypothetical protein